MDNHAREVAYVSLEDEKGVNHVKVLIKECL